MNAKAKQIALRTQKFVVDHKVAIAVTTTASICVAGHLKVIRDINARLVEMGVDVTEFYSENL